MNGSSMCNSESPKKKQLKIKREIFYEGGSICNKNPFINPSPNASGVYVVCQTNDQSIAFIMVQETLFYLSKYNKLQTF